MQRGQVAHFQISLDVHNAFTGDTDGTATARRNIARQYHRTFDQGTTLAALQVLVLGPPHKTKQRHHLICVTKNEKKSIHYAIWYHIIRYLGIGLCVGVSYGIIP